MSVVHIWKLQENTATLCKIGCKTLRVSAIRGFGYVWLGKLKCHPLPSGVRILDVRHPNGMSAAAEFRMWDIWVECRRSRISDVRHPGGMSTEQNSGCETSGWNVDDSRILDVRHSGGISVALEFRMWDIRVDCRRSRISDVRHPGGMSWSRIPDVLSGSLTKVHESCYVIPTACHSPRSAALRWCVQTPCPNIFYHGFQRTLLNLGLLWWSKSYQNTKT